ncbi:MAG TPA: MATE family efflux transporter [Firmicutes bacterium]|nr:MATE family efflux transporter [Bacillota bacterium]
MNTKEKTRTGDYLFDNHTLFILIAPLIAEQLLATIVGLADSIMVASVGEAAVSGVSLVDSIMLLLINIFTALATGGAVVAGQYLGRHDPKKACEASNQLVWFVTLISIVIMALVYAGKYFILHIVFGQIEPDVMAHADTYLTIVAASIPFIALYNAGAAIFRSMGNSKISMQVSIIMNIINIGGNALLIYVFHMGTAGVAIPTLVSRIVAAVLMVILLCNQELVLHMEKTFRYKPDWALVRRILYIGVPNGMENSMFQLGKIIVLSLVSTFGTYAIAANAVSNVVASFQTLPGVAMSLAVTTVISRCIGAGEYEQVEYYTRKLHKITYLCMWVTIAIILAAMPLILWAYQLSDVTAQTASRIMLLHGLCAAVIWPIAFTLPGTLRSAGDVRFSMIVSVTSMWICRIVFSYLLGQGLQMGVFGVWVAMILDWCVRACCFMIRYKRGKWKTKQVI